MKNTQIDWNFSLLYKNSCDPQIEADLASIEIAMANFEDKHKSGEYTSSPEKLAVAMKDYEKLAKDTMDYKPLVYFSRKSDLNSEDNESRALLSKYQDRLTKASNRITFFDLNIGKIPQEDHQKFLTYPNLQQYVYFLEKIFDASKHFLSEKEEKLASLLQSTSYSMWVEGQEKILSQKTIEHKAEEIPLQKAVSILSDLETREERSSLQTKINNILKSSSLVAEMEINAVYTYKKIMDELRGFTKPYSNTLLSYENDEKTIELLVALVTKNFSKISQRFYKLHAKILGETKLPYYDRGLKIGKISKKFDFDTSVSIIGEAFAKIDPKYKKILDSFIENGQIDVYPKKGKRGGAYCAGSDALPTFVLLNHVDNIDSLETLAHEMGHAIHQELSNLHQPILYKGQPISTAEVASTFFGQVASAEVEKYLSDDQKIILLHNKLMGDMGTIFLQISGFNFELELHNKIRSEGRVSEVDIARMLKKHLEKFFGEAIDVREEDSYFFVRWNHIRTFFYMYSYAYGQIISRALFENWQKDSNFSIKIEQFLSAGSSMSPEDIFKHIGIDTSDPRFFEAGLRSIEKDIDRLEELTSETK